MVAKSNLANNKFDTVSCSVGNWRYRETLPDKSFDIVVCLGNSLAHLSSREDLVNSLHSFYDILEDEGTLITDQRNYDGIMSGDVDGSTRNYCCTGLNTSCDLKVLSTSTVEIVYTTSGYGSESIMTHAWHVKEIHSALEEAGFVVKNIYGENGTPYSLHFAPIDKRFLNY